MADEDADDGSSGTPSILQRYLVIMSPSPLVAYNCLLNHCDLSCSRIAARDWSLLVRAELFRRGHYVTHSRAATQSRFGPKWRRLSSNSSDTHRCALVTISSGQWRLIAAELGRPQSGGQRGVITTAP